MAKINFEATTLLGGEFIKMNEFNETTEVVLIEAESAESGFHLISRGKGAYYNGWCDGDYNEWYLKLGRIALMEVNERWYCNHNNWYGSTQYVRLLDIDEFDAGNTIITLEWVKEIELEDEEWEETFKILVSIDTKELSKYKLKHNILHHFVYEMDNIEYNVEYERFLHESEELEEIEIIEEVEWE